MLPTLIVDEDGTLLSSADLEALLTPLGLEHFLAPGPTPFEVLSDEPALACDLE